MKAGIFKMGIPTKGTVFGQIELDEKIYDIITSPISDKIREDIHKYRSENHCISSSASFLNDGYRWVVEDDKLYLTAINISCLNKEYIAKLEAREEGKEFSNEEKREYFSNYNKQNILESLFNTDKLFAEWFSGEIEVVLESDEVIKNNRKFVTLKLNILTTIEGKVVSSKETIEKYDIRHLDYIVE